MKGWKLFGGGKNQSADDADEEFSPRNAQSPGNVRAQETGFMGFMSSRYDNRMERNVSLAARNLGDGVQIIVMAAKARHSSASQSVGSTSGTSTTTTEQNWKADLLALLGATNKQSDIDVLLENSTCEKFVLRCIENELPPNLIHCLRLLRVMELQHAKDANNNKGDVEPVGEIATKKVSKLLTILCTDPTVGEQLRPHLFGLLALSGASYPKSGIHVARAASEVIIAFSKHCLSKSLVVFLHDRKMIIHMTDDIKELCGISQQDFSATGSATSSLSLYGNDAEQVGLWAIALKTVVHLVVHSCHVGSKDLLKDFVDIADGYKVIKYCIMNSTSSRNGRELIELIPLLTCVGNSSVEEILDTAKLATHASSFELVYDLMRELNPLVKEYHNVYDKRPELHNDESLYELADFALKSAVKIRFSENKIETVFKFDAASEILNITLQLYSDHPNNYTILENQFHVLTLFLLSIPTLEDESLKLFIMKTLEFVLTGVANTDDVKPMKATVAIFFASCSALLLGEDGQMMGDMIKDAETREKLKDSLFDDVNLMGGTLEKLVQFDNRVVPLLMGSGILEKGFNNILDLICKYSKKQDSLATTLKANGTVCPVPPISTALDRIVCAVCRILILLVSQIPTDSASTDNNNDLPEASNLHKLLQTVVKELGQDASKAAAGVFEGHMSAYISKEVLKNDLDFVLDILDYFSKMTASACTGADDELFSTSDDNDDKESSLTTKKEKTKLEVVSLILMREAVVILMLKTVLETRSLARETFRNCGGFDTLIRVILSLQGVTKINQKGAKTDENHVELLDDTFMDAFVTLLQAVLQLIDAATGCRSRSNAGGVEASEILVDPISSQLSLMSAASYNRNYMRERGFYLDLATAIACTGILDCGFQNVRAVLEVAMGHVDPKLKLSSTENGSEAEEKPEVSKPSFKQPADISLRNPDAIRFVIGVTVFIPKTESGMTVSEGVMKDLLELCSSTAAASTLSQIASCGICWSVSNPKEFAPLLDDNSHHLHSQFVEMLRRIAAFSMSYSDFVSLLRCVVGPMLRADGLDSRIRLPVISSSVARSVSRSSSEAWQAQENDFCDRLLSLCVVAENGIRVPHCRVGGDSINTIAVLMHQVKVEDRLHATARERHLKFVEIESVDASAVTPGGLSTAGTVAPSSGSGSERVWTPLASTGFSYSMWMRHSVSSTDNFGNFFILDISSPAASSSSNPQNAVYLSVWYDIQNQRFNVVSSASHRSEPTCFPVSPLSSGAWHHILLTYSPPKRSMMSRKAIFGIYVDGRPLEAEVKVESVNLPPNSRIIVGSPNPTLATSGIVRGLIPLWDVGPTLMLSTILLDLDATAIFMFGPDYPGFFWGDRPQRLSLAATGTAAFSMLAENGEQGSVASALRRRDLAKFESAGIVSRQKGIGNQNHEDNDSLASLGLLCTLPPDSLVFGFRAATISNRLRVDSTASRSSYMPERLINVARINNSNESVSTDAIVHGKSSVVAPLCFSDNLQWAGGPALLMPVVNAAQSIRSLALSLRLVRESVQRHPPNLEMMQAGGGYRMLAVLLKEKRLIHETILDQCVAFAVHGIFNGSTENETDEVDFNSPSVLTESSKWVFSDLDAMKHLLLNHQVYGLRNSGPVLALRLLGFLNLLVAQQAVHKAFNARRLHLLGIVRWALHLMLDAAELYATGKMGKALDESHHTESAKSIGGPAGDWFFEAPPVDEVAVGGDPGNPFLQSCKSLLRRVLTFMLTPVDLEAVAEAVIYTVSSIASGGRGSASDKQKPFSRNNPREKELVDGGKLLPGQIVRVYLVRLLEELIVDGVNEIVASAADRSAGDSTVPMEQMVRPHAGGIASQNRSYLSSTLARGKRHDGSYHPKHDQVQAFLSAFARVLTPVWFAALLEGCHEQASASAVLRLMILMLQGSASFEASFRAAGGFAPLVLSIPRFSTCPGINMSMLSLLLHVPILHLPCFPTLDAAQLCEVFDAESEETDSITVQDGSDPSCGIFSLLAECLGRNIQLATLDNDLGKKARNSNNAILELLAHRHTSSNLFQQFCGSPTFLEPLSQALCLVHDEKIRTRKSPGSASDSGGNDALRGSLNDRTDSLTPTERFIGRLEETGSTGVGMVNLLKQITTHAIVSGPLAAPLVSALFCSFPIHASPEQVEAFHLVLIEICKSVVEDAMQNGDVMAVANCVGVSSVLLDQLMTGFFTSEHIYEAVTMILSILGYITTPDTYVANILEPGEHSLLATDAAHMARLTTVAALRSSRSRGPHDKGDQGLQLESLKIISSNIQSLLLLPSNGGQGGRRLTVSNSGLLKPQPGSKLYPLWQSASLMRCCASWKERTYPDITESDQPDRVFVLNLLVEINRLLSDDKEEIRAEAISIFVSLLQERRPILSEILIAEIRHGDRVETIDVMNRGGFSALLAAHEAAVIAEKHSTNVKSVSSSRRNYAAFFDWLGRNEAKVQLVFELVNTEAARLFPGLEMTTGTPREAVEKEQKRMLLKLTSRETSDSTILGGLERAELVQRCFNKTSESHTYWKRQGFDDIASGAMQWKVLLRQLKGSCLIWEGGPDFEHQSFSTWRNHLFAVLESKIADSKRSDEIGRVAEVSRELVKRWKLDLSEGFERQRRRLLPNYEFHGLYNIDEMADDDIDANKKATSDASPIEQSNGINPSADFFGAGAEEATAELLKDLNIKRANNREDDDYEYEDTDAVDDESQTEATTASASSMNEGESLVKKELDSNHEQNQSNGTGTKNPKVDVSNRHENKTTEPEHVEDKEHENDSSYELITGLLQAGDWPTKSYNVRRCTGLEVRKGLLLWCQDAIYVVDGFEQTGGGGLDGKITRLEKEQSSFYINLRPKDFKISEEQADLDVSAIGPNAGESATKKKGQKEKTSQDMSNEVTYQHRSQRIAFSELDSVFRRRYQLQQIALEFYDSNKNGTLIAFSDNAEREEVLTKVLQCPLPNSIFSSSYGTSINYKKFMSNLRDKIVGQWVKGKMSNFDFLMHMNSFAGRSYNDLTQYPVFPWVIADYESEEIDLDDPMTYRDLSKPMGALGEERAQQFSERYAALAAHCFSDDDPPPFHYGTHYSCAAYVLYYLMRLEPFSRLALSLQGGRFDVADRLFHDVGRSWKSSSSENLQDVRELIPEFFYLPDFLKNTNNFDFGTTQKGKTVHDVTLPKWAKGDVNRFVRINRQALESNFVSAHLHLWVDLVFGYKQRGQEAVDALNTFVHVTYEGEVDLDAMTDPIQRASTIAQIQNFGQTPSRLWRKPFPQRIVSVALRDKSIDFGCLSDIAPLTPPFCIVGAPQRVNIKPTLSDTCKLGLTGSSDRSVGDMCLVKGQIVGVGRMCSLILPLKKYYRFGGQNNGISVHVASASVRQREVNKILSIHDGMHRAPISVARASLDGHWLVTGCVDSTVRVWRFKDQNRVELRATLSGHEGSQIKCLDVCTDFGTIVTGCGRGKVLLWDLRTLTFVRQLRCESDPGQGNITSSLNCAVSVSLNHQNGNIVTLVGSFLRVFDINGNLLATKGPWTTNRPTCAVATDCPEWMEQGVVAVTGHLNGEIRMWTLDYDRKELIMRHIMPDNPHGCEITAMRITGAERQDTLLVGDKSGLMSVCKTLQLDSFNNQELAEIVTEIRNKVKLVDSFHEERQQS